MTDQSKSRNSVEIVVSQNDEAWVIHHKRDGTVRHQRKAPARNTDMPLSECEHEINRLCEALFAVSEQQRNEEQWKTWAKWANEQYRAATGKDLPMDEAAV